MTISYQWLLDYLPKDEHIKPWLLPEKLAVTLTSIGLEVENLQKKETYKGGFTGLITGEVLTCAPHPNADKLKITTVNTGNEILNIICGASNVAVGKKVVVAPAGTTIYPIKGEPITLKKTKIRGIESEGMICAEDEIGLSENHDGILILQSNIIPGTPVAELYKNEEDYCYEIGLTPNRTDAMSHYGVARDVCAFLTYHCGKSYQPFLPTSQTQSQELASISISVQTDKCGRYCGALISGVTVTESPEWLQKKLKSIGVNPVNNIVDVTNFILHESGQPLHAFDADKIIGNEVIIRNAIEGEAFITLDDKQRKLSTSDIVIAHSGAAMCLAGVYGGKESGVSAATKKVFIESAQFDASAIRKTSLYHALRADAATRFEKGIDISKTYSILQRAVNLIIDTAGGSIDGIKDVYPIPALQHQVELTFNYLHKLSGKVFTPENVKTILSSLGFEITHADAVSIGVNVPAYKHDIQHPADLVEEIVRIDGLDNIPIPQQITLTPAKETLALKYALKEKISQFLSSSNYEIFTNSITNSAYFSTETLSASVSMMNSLSSELNLLRPSMINSGLEAIAYNINRKNTDCRFFEFGKTYSNNNHFSETEHLVVYITGYTMERDWQHVPEKTSLFYLKGLIQKLFEVCGVKITFIKAENSTYDNEMQIIFQHKNIGRIAEVGNGLRKQHDIKQPVYFADIEWTQLLTAKKMEAFREISRFPAMERDLALVIDKKISYAEVEKAVVKLKIANLTSVKLFDVFESEKLGAGKKSMAVNFVFADESRTLTDDEVDASMKQLAGAFQKELNAEIRQ